MFLSASHTQAHNTPCNSSAMAELRQGFQTISSPAFTVPRCDSASPTVTALGSNCGSGATPDLNRLLFPVSSRPLGDTRRPTKSRDAMRLDAGRLHCRNSFSAKSHHPRDLFLEPPNNLGAHDSNRHKAGAASSPACTGAADMDTLPLPSPSLQADYVTSHCHFLSSVRCSSEHRGSAIAKWQKSLDAS